MLATAPACQHGRPDGTCPALLVRGRHGPDERAPADGRPLRGYESASRPARANLPAGPGQDTEGADLRGRTCRSAGRVILLDGASSSGKSSLAKAYARSEPFLHVSSDQFVAAGMLPERRNDGGTFDWWHQVRPRFFDGFHHCLRRRTLTRREVCLILGDRECQISGDIRYDVSRVGRPRCVRRRGSSTRFSATSLRHALSGHSRPRAVRRDVRTSTLRRPGTPLRGTPTP
ncbi:phosphotransferase-like protein [Cryptosporangium arvum]|uniref:phosphotransferase-like protein n=1 Tax=Cryptosporangium arvum TaxID=80871 RepID=UPI00316AE546